MTSRDHVPSPRPIAAKEIPLIDRVEEMNVLKEAVYRAVHGEGGFVFIHGEAGIGKTRLVRELDAYASSRGVKVLHGRCPALFRMDGVPPYFVWKEIIKDYLGECTPDQLHKVIGYYPAEVAKLVPEVSLKLKEIHQSLPIGPEQEQNRLFEAVSQFITNISSESPLLVVLDDLQWTDPSSLLLLHYLVRGIQKNSLLLLGAYRSTDVDPKHPLTTVLAELKRECTPQAVSLRRMSLDDASELIREILGQEDIPQKFCSLIYEKTRGNPFFTIETIESLKEEETIYRKENKWKIREVEKIEFPETVKNVVEARVGRLNDDCINALKMASLIGNDFTFRALREVTDLHEDTLRSTLDELLKTGLIKHRVVRGEDVCSFADVIVRDVVYEEFGAFERKRLHSVVGSALEKVYKETIDEHSGELASHFLDSGEKDKALYYFLKAGEKAHKIYANAEVISYYRSALALLEKKEGECRKQALVLEVLGDTKKIVGEYDDCLNYWNDAARFWIQLDERQKVAGLHRKMAAVLWHDVGKKEQAQAHFDEALKILETEPKSVELAALYAARASMSYFTEDAMKACSWAEKALELGEELKASEVVASAYVSLGLVFRAMGKKKEAVERTEKALKIALDNGYVDVALGAYNNLAGQLPSGENERVLDCYEKGLELARKAGHTQRVAWFEGRLAGMYRSMGNMDKALALAMEYDTLSRKIGNLLNISNSTFGLGIHYQWLGEWDKADLYLGESLTISQKINNTQQISNSYLGLGWSHYDRGEYSKARDYFEKMSDIYGKSGQKAYRVSHHAQTALNYIELGEIDKARTLLDEMREFAHETQNKGLIAEEDATRAMLLRAEKKWNDSIELFERSLREFEAMGARKWDVYWLAKNVLLEYARAYFERNQGGDKEKAHELLSQALETFQKMGARKDIEKVEAKIAFIETGKEAPKPKPVELVSTGYSVLDKMLYGGIAAGCAVVLSSPTCGERDDLVKSFLETGAKKGEITLYVTTSPSAAKPLVDKFPSNFYLFACNPQADAIIKNATNFFKLNGVENLTDINIALTSAIRRLAPSLISSRRICIEPISDILLQHHSVQTRRWLTALITELKSTGFTILAVIDPQMHPSEELHAILGLFDGEIHIYEKETSKGFGRYLRVKKMSNQKYVEDELPLKKEQL